MRNRIIPAITVLTIAMILTPARAQTQQGGTTRFVYDDNGRLTAVIAPNGEAAIYEYDAGGNQTRIRRIGTDSLMLLAFFPQVGGAGDEVTFVGTGFNAGVTSVSFNGVAAQIASATASAVRALVPDAATTGPVTIVTPRGTLVTPVDFTIAARVRVFPSAAVLFPGEAIALTAVLDGSGDQGVVWAVNGINGGNETVGTISTAGFYIAPATLTGNASLSVAARATSVAQPVLFGEARIRVLNLNSLGDAFAHAVSLRRGDPLGVRAALSPVVAVRRGAVISTPLPFLSARISVRFGLADGNAPITFSRFVSVTNGPSISSILPSGVARGSSAALTINGANLGGASALMFLTSSGVVDTAITASNLTASPDGKQLTAMVAVSSGASPGTRVVVVAAQSGTTSPVNTGPNTITIQ